MTAIIVVVPTVETIKLFKKRFIVAFLRDISFYQIISSLSLIVSISLIFFFPLYST